MIKDWLYSRFQTLRFEIQFHFSSVAQSCPSVCNPKDCSTPGLPVHHHLLEFTQIHVHWVGDAIQSSHPLSSPSPPTFNLSQHQGLYQWISSSHEVAKVLEFQFQHQSFQWTPFRVFIIFLHTLEYELHQTRGLNGIVWYFNGILVILTPNIQ